MINLLAMLQLNWWFAGAALACACVPLIIHLLNRRRYRTLQWAAMDFLKQALQRNRRIMQIRDLLLLALRTLAVLLFGLALAQPLWKSQSNEDFDPSNRKPLHAVLIVDNSMSMAYEPPGQESVLQRAKERATDFINELPSGSRVTVVPLCAWTGSYSLDPYRTTEDAIAAVEQITVAHRSTNIENAKNIALKASELESSFAKRIVFISDQQQANWAGRVSADTLKSYPAMQVVDVSVETPENSWISEFRLDDDIADVETPANFTVRLRHSGQVRRKDAQVSLHVEDTEVAVKRIDLEPGSAEQEVTFSYTFDDIALDTGTTKYVPVKVKLSSDEHDRLPLDNERFLMVPVVSALPVVFIDELGERDENPSLGRYGETWQLRRLLVPIVDRNDTSRQLVKITHIAADEISQDVLAEARLVVIAGVEQPANVELLREYVAQGGQLFIAAGGQFDPSAWNSAAWLEGEGILPAPLQAELIGQLPGTEGAKYDWFELKYDSSLRTNGLFQLTDETDADLAALYTEPYFFQAVEVADVGEADDEYLQQQAEKLRDELTQLVEATARLGKSNGQEEAGGLTDEQLARQAADEEALRRLRPGWLQWVDYSDEEKLKDLAGNSESLQQYANELARDERPQVLARFTNEHPYLVTRKIGRGRVMFAASGIKPEWNMLGRTSAVLLLDRIVRGMINSTLPRHTFIAQDSISLPVLKNTSGLQLELNRPVVGDEATDPETLNVGYIGSQTRGITIHNPLHQGIYRIAAYSPGGSADASAGREEIWNTAIAININEAGEGEESELAPLTRAFFEERTAGEELPIRWVAAGESISLDGSSVRGNWWWKALAFVVLVLLLVEIAILAWPAVAASQTENPSEASA